MRICKYVIIFFIYLFISISVSMAQGTLIGVVSDSISGIDLPGANVMLEGTSIGASTDINGEYRISGLNEGSHKVVVSYIGYQDIIIPIEISGDETKVLSIALIPIAIEGEVITITAQAEGQVAAINQQVNSNTIINVVSEEKIKELPDANAAEAIGRLPGVSITRTGGEANKVILRGLEDKFTAIYLDGIRVPATDATSRGIDLSTISQSALAGIELAKAVTSDKDGDALAGSIDLVSKKAPDEREFRTNIKGNYNDLTESANQYDLSFHYGERFFNNILGVQVAGNLERKIRSSERLDVSHRYRPPADDFIIQNLTVEFTDEIRTRNGLSLLLDINTPDDGSIRINNVFNGTKRDYLTHSRDYPEVDAVTYDFRQREQEINTWSSSIRGDNHLLGLGLNWGLSFAESKSGFPFDYQMIFNEAGPHEGMNTQDTPYPQIFDYKEAPEKIIPLATNHFDLAPQAYGYFRDQDNYEKERTAYLNISKDYNILDNISGQIKVGTKYKVKDRTNKTLEDFSPYYLDGQWQENEFIITGNDTTIRPKDFSGTYFEEWNNTRQTGFIYLDQFFSNAKTRDVYDEYKLTPLMVKERLKQWQKLNKNGIDPTGHDKEVWNNPLTNTDDYDITENVSAFYLMNTLKIGQQLTFICGLRTEHEYNNYSGVYMKGSVGGFPIPENVLHDTTSFAQQTVYLPNFHLAYEATDYLKIRLAVYKALARPDFNMRIDRWVAGRHAVTTDFSTKVGNINLKTAEAWNYEINTSFYGNNIGLISLSAFYKEIDNMYHMLNDFGTQGDTLLNYFNIDWRSGFSPGVSYDISLPYNSTEPTKVWGFEFEHQINLHFLPGYLKNFVLSYNASIVKSETQVIVAKRDSVFNIIIPPDIGAWEYFDVPAKQITKLEAQPEVFGNIVLGYDLAGFSGRISLYHQEEYNSSYSARRYQIKKAITRIDVALKQKITDNFSLFLNLNNITNVEDGNDVFDEGIRRFDKSEKYGMTIDFGILGNF